MNNQIAIIKFAGGIKLRGKLSQRRKKKIKYSMTLVIWSKGEKIQQTLSEQDIH